MTPDYYETLGLERFASAQAVRVAFRQMAKELHPDLNPRADAQERFMRVREAYEALSDPERKASYDKHLHELDEAGRRRAAQEATVRPTPRATPRTPPPSRKPSPKRPAATKGPAPRYQLQDGNDDAAKLARLLRRHKYAEADMVAERILRSNPQEAAAYAAIADVARYRGDLDRSARYYAYAAQFDPDNPVFERKYLEVVDLQASHPVADAADLNRAPVYAALVTLAVVGAALVFAPESATTGIRPLAVGLGHVVALVVAGTVTGAALASAGLLDRLETLGSATGSRVSPPVALALLSLACFWASVSAYWVVGAGQKAFNPSLSRLLGGSVAALVVVVAFTLARSGAAAGQVFLLGGNLLFPSALVGWGLADVFRGLKG
ncbi:MAG: DnaJ domain-containing protein [Fimbriimonadaceae bacterium]|nr:DnaJ domain-containing protein [Fimbriimonadaceae bacterium]